MKKIIAVCLSMVLIFSTIICVFANGKQTIEVSNATANPGEEVKLTVSLNGNPGINTFSLGFNYDTTRLQLDNVALSSGIPGQFTYAKKAVWLNSADVKQDGAYLDLTFTVLETAAEGDAAVTVTYSAGDICNLNEDDVNFDIVAGKITVANKPAEEKPSAKYELTSVTGVIGKNVTMYISIADNPGIVSLNNSIIYDESVMTLTSVTDLEILNGYKTPSPTVSSPYILRWVDSLSLENNTQNGRIAALTFSINENAAVGNYEVTVKHNEARNSDGEKYDFAAATATVTVINVIKGDVDDDGRITDWDAILLNRYLSGWNVEVVELACDIDENGEVTDWDVILLERYLAGWDVKEFA